MGYNTVITLQDVRVKKKHIAHLRKCIRSATPETESFHYILENLGIEKSGELQWIGEPSGKWYRDKELGVTCDPLAF
jgi:hypothetical protein